MKRLLLLIVCHLPVVSTLAAAESDMAAYCRMVDEAIEHASNYIAAQEQRIGEARRALELETTPTGKYQRNYRLYELYKAFVSDSAMYFLHQCIALADATGDASAGVRCRSLLAIRCANIGMYDEALNILDSLTSHLSPLTSHVDTLALGTYYEAYNNVYAELAYYTHLDDMRQNYQERAEHYERLMLQTMPRTYETCFLRREQRAQGEGRLDESMAINDEWLHTVEPGSHPYALVALYRYIEYKMQGDNDQMVHWLVESVLADIRNGVMDQGSMWELANELMLRGETDKASSYIAFTSDCANRYGSRQRNWQIAPLLTTIAKNYKAQSERTTALLRTALVVSSVLALLPQPAAGHRPAGPEDLERRTGHGKLSAGRTDARTVDAECSTFNGQLSTLREQPRQGGVHRAVYEPLLAVYRQAGQLPQDGEQEDEEQGAGRAVPDVEVHRAEGARTGGAVPEFRLSIPPPVPQLRQRLQRPAATRDAGTPEGGQPADHRNTHLCTHPSGHRGLVEDSRVPSLFGEHDLQLPCAHQEWCPP